MCFVHCSFGQRQRGHLPRNLMKICIVPFFHRTSLYTFDDTLNGLIRFNFVLLGKTEERKLLPENKRIRGDCFSEILNTNNLLISVCFLLMIT